MFRSPFRRAHAAPSLPDDALPLSIEAALEVACDEAARIDTRIAAIARLEHGARTHAFAVARRLTAALAAPPDVAARAHLALLVLAPRLAIGRADDGSFVASARPIDDAAFDGLTLVDPSLGRVVGLDALATLLAPDEAPPAFLVAAPVAAPKPYRPAAHVLAQRAADEQRAAARATRRAQLMALGLDEDDLSEDAEERLRAARRMVPRRDAPVCVEIAEPLELALEADGERHVIGRALPGEWWSDLRVGDHKGSMRLHVRLARDAPSDALRIRRTPMLHARRGEVAIVFGADRIEHLVNGTGLLAFVEEEPAGVVGVTLTWSSRRGVRSAAS